MNTVMHMEYYVALFHSVSHVMKAEKMLKIRNIPHRIIPVPKEISSDCGVCIRFEKALLDDITAVFIDQEGVREYRPL